MLRVFTAHLGYDGPDRLDVSRQGSDPFGVVFAPSWELLRSYKDKKRAGRADRAAWARYEAAYRAEMATSAAVRAAHWERLLARDVVTLCCYCWSGNPCHRQVLAHVLAARGATYEGER